MIKWFLLILITGVLASIFCGALKLAGETAPSATIPKIFVVTFSGVRNSESIDDPLRQYLPNLRDVIFKQGVLYSNVIDLNFQFHMPSVSAIISGRTYEWGNRLKAPSLYQYIRKQYSLPLHKVWSFGDWIVNDCALEAEGFSSDTFPAQIVSLGMKMSPETEALVAPLLTEREKRSLERFRLITSSKLSEWPQWDSIGTFQTRLLMKIIRRYKPFFVHYVMNDVESAHYDTFGRYVIALHSGDQRIFDLWKIITTDPEYIDNTYLFITVDHSRNAYYMQHYDNDLARPKPVWLFMYGPGIMKNKVIDRQIHHIDMFATIARILNLDVHPTRGQMLEDAFSAARP